MYSSVPINWPNWVNIVFSVRFDAVALATRITPHIDTLELHRAYFGEGGPNPWGGVEAILTHLADAGVSAEKAVMRYGAEGTGLSIYLNDPDDNQIELKGPALHS
mgnify:CR=1 FL=1